MAAGAMLSPATSLQPVERYSGCKRRRLDVSSMRVSLLFGSQTGNAEEISKLLQAAILEAVDAQGLPLDVVHMSMKDYVKGSKKGIDRLVDDELLVLVCSTTGAGDPPDNAQLFYRKLRRKKQKVLPESDFLRTC